ncbi:MAG: tandem-95 repeat protein, partial [Planctomycetaceae bacterium]|nr:tandem-95 repeat protein [Planctomycetaceae bacterium]
MTSQFQRWLELWFNRKPIASRRRRLRPVADCLELFESRVMLSAVSWTGQGDGTTWSDVANWSTGSLPDSTSDVTLNAPAGTTIHGPSSATTINNLIVKSADFILDGGDLTVSTKLDVQNAQNLSVQGGILTATNITLENSTLTLSGGTIANSILTETGGSELVASHSGGTLNGVALDGTLDLSQGPLFGTSYLYVVNGLTLQNNAQVLLGNEAGTTFGALFFDGTQTLGGVGTVILGSSTENLLQAGNDDLVQTLTIGPQITVRGHTGSLGGSINSTIINLGTILADTSVAPDAYLYDTGFSTSTTGTLTSPNSIDTSNITNPAPEDVYSTYRYAIGTMRYTLTGLDAGAKYTLNLDFATGVSSVGAQTFNVDSNGTLLLSDFDIYATAGASLKAVRKTKIVTADEDGQIVLTFTTIKGTAQINGIELLSGTTRVTAINCGATGSGTIRIVPPIFSNQGIIQAINGETLSLEGIWSNDSSITSTGATLDLEGYQSISSTTFWTNDGEITVTGGVLNLGGQFTTATLATLNYSNATVNLVGTLDNTNSTLELNDTTGSLYLSGGKLLNGVVAATGGSELIATHLGGTLDGVALDGILDLSQDPQSAYATVTNGLTLQNNSLALLGNEDGANHGQLYFKETQTLGGTGDIVFGESDGNLIQVEYSNEDQVLTIGPQVTVRGSAGRLSGSGHSTIINQGTISADSSVAPGAYSYDTGYSTLTPKEVYTLSSSIDTSGVANPAPQDVYRTYRSVVGKMTYMLTGLDAGASYALNLDFVTDMYTVGSQTFNVDSNGTPLLSNFDIYATAGASYKAIREAETVTADTDGQIELTFASINGAAQINGIELLSGTTRVKAINCGATGSGVFTIDPGIVSNQGTLLVANGETLKISGLTGNLGAATLSESGRQLVLSGTNYVVNDALTATASQTLTLNGSWTNTATITSTDGTLSLGDQSSNSTNRWTNTGTIAVTDSTVDLGGFFTMAALGDFHWTGSLFLTGTLDNTNTTLDLSGTSGSWHLSGGTIENGTVTETGGAELIVSASGGTLDGVTVNGDVDVTKSFNVPLTVLNTLTLNGTLAVGAADGSTWGSVSFGNFQSSSAMLAGNATLVFGSNYANFMAAASGGDGQGGALILASGVTVHGNQATIYGNSCTIINQGTFSADGGSTIRTDNYVKFENQGTVSALNGSTLIVFGLSGNLDVATVTGTGSQLLLSGSDYVINQPLMVDNGQTLSLGGTWTNSSTITAADGTLNLGDQSSFSTNSWTNSGTITTTGGTIDLGGSFTLAGLGNFRWTGSLYLTGTLDNSNTTLFLSGTSGSWHLNGGTIKNGAVTETGGAELVVSTSGGTLDGVTVNGDVDVTKSFNVPLTVLNTLTLNGTLSVGAADGSTWGSVTFGSFQFS